MSSQHETLEKAASEQISLASLVVVEDYPPFNKSIVTGVDVHYGGPLAFGCAVVMEVEALEPIQTVTLSKEVEYDYIPGYLYLREGPIILDLLKLLDKTGPVMIDGNGILHPRRLGLASYVGVMLNTQTIGVTKRLHIGTVGNRVKDEAPILDDGYEIGKAVWLGRASPLFVSVGNNITLSTSVEIVKECSSNGYPEPLRRAHGISKRMARRK